MQWKLPIMPVVVGRDATSGIPTDKFVFFSINHASYAEDLESWDGTFKISARV
jgi:hypothetical protein